MCQALHTIFMQQYTGLWDSKDMIAERIRGLKEYSLFGGDVMKKLTIITDSTLHLQVMEIVN